MIEPLPKRRPVVVGGAEGRPAAYVYGDVLREIRFNGGWKRNALAGGLLVGGHFRCPDTQTSFVEIEGFLAAAHCDNIPDFLRYLRLQWKAAATTLRYSFPTAEVVGWFAAFPEPDVLWDASAALLHNSFFNHPWQVGLWVPANEERLAALVAEGDQLAPWSVGVIGAPVTR